MVQQREGLVADNDFGDHRVPQQQLDGLCCTCQWYRASGPEGGEPWVLVSARRLGRLSRSPGETRSGCSVALLSGGSGEVDEAEARLKRRNVHEVTYYEGWREAKWLNEAEERRRGCRRRWSFSAGLKRAG